MSHITCQNWIVSTIFNIALSLIFLYLLSSTTVQVKKVRKRSKMRHRYNQAPHLTQDTNGRVTTSQLDITNESQEISPICTLLFNSCVRSILVSLSRKMYKIWNLCKIAQVSYCVQLTWWHTFKALPRLFCATIQYLPQLRQNGSVEIYFLFLPW